MVGASENCPASSTTSRSRERRGIVPSFAKVHAVPPTTPPVPVSAHDDRNAETAALFFTGVHAAASSSSSVAPDFGTFTTRSADTPARTTDDRKFSDVAWDWPTTRRASRARGRAARRRSTRRRSCPCRRALDRQVRPVEPEQRRDDRGDGVVAGDRGECAQRRDPAEQVERGVGQHLRQGVEDLLAPLGDRLGLRLRPWRGGRREGDREVVVGLPPPTAGSPSPGPRTRRRCRPRPARPREPTRPSNRRRSGDRRREWVVVDEVGRASRPDARTGASVPDRRISRDCERARGSVSQSRSTEARSTTRTSRVSAQSSTGLRRRSKWSCQKVLASRRW